MSEKIRQFIDQLASGETSAAKETIETDLSSRAFEALDDYKKQIAENFFGNQTNKEIIKENFSEQDYHTSHSGYHGHPLNHITGNGTGSIKDHNTNYLKKAHAAHMQVVDNEYENADSDHTAKAAHTHAKKAVNDIEHELKSRKVKVSHPINNSHYKF
jgi:hypothetical protein